MEIDVSVAFTGRKSLRVVGITSTGTPWHSKVRYEKVPVKKDEILTVAFWAKVDAKEGQRREVEVSAQLENDPWPGFYNKAIILDSNDWKEYTDTLVVKSDKEQGMWIGLSVAQSNIDFWIDDFRLFEGGPDEEIKGVEAAINPMNKYTVSWGAIKSYYEKQH